MSSIPEQNPENPDDINEIIYMEEETPQLDVSSIEQDRDMHIGADSEVSELISNETQESDNGNNDNEKTKDKLRGTNKAAVLKQKKSAISTLQKLTKATQTDYMRGQVNVESNAFRGNEDMDRVAPMSSFQASADFWLGVWDSLWLP